MTSSRNIYCLLLSTFLLLVNKQRYPCRMWHFTMQWNLERRGCGFLCELTSLHLTVRTSETHYTIYTNKRIIGILYFYPYSFVLFYSLTSFLTVRLGRSFQVLNLYASVVSALLWTNLLDVPSFLLSVKWSFGFF